MIAPVLKTLFRKDPVRSQAERLYAALADQARAPEFYKAGNVPDTPEGRFDLLSVHMFLAIRRLREGAPGTDRLVRLLQEVFFERLDSALREMGVGDLSVGRKIRGLAEAFYGRFAAYESGLSDGGLSLESALARNVLGENETGRASRLGAYVRKAANSLADETIDRLEIGIPKLREISLLEFSGERP